MKRTILHAAAVVLLLLQCPEASAERNERRITRWAFTNSDKVEYSLPDFDDTKWKRVSIPHDWAISGPFNKEIDKQVVAIEQNGEKEATEKTGR